MRIRSLTIGVPLDHQSTAAMEAGVKRLLAVTDDLLPDSPRTRRFTLPASGAEAEAEGSLLSRLRWVDGLAQSTGVRWFCVPLDFVAAGPRQGRIQAALDGIRRFSRMFLNLMVADGRQMAVNAVNDVAQLVLDVSRLSNNGFDNFRVGASFNCPPGAPFFPFSRHDGETLDFSFAVETTQVAQDALAHRQPQGIDRLRDRLVAALIPGLTALEALGQRIAAESGATYRGLDASFAPLPAEDVSVAGLVERVAQASAGSHGSLFATAFLSDAIRTAVEQSGVRTVGFNGVMYSVLEDRVLAAATSQRRLSVGTLLSLATVCGCGLDMVPIPGLSFPEEVAAVMLDVAALSCALNKPLGARLLPIPGGRVNDFTQLNLDFLCDARILGLTANDRRINATGQTVGFHTPRS